MNINRRGFLTGVAAGVLAMRFGGPPPAEEHETLTIHWLEDAPPRVVNEGGRRLVIHFGAPLPRIPPTHAVPDPWCPKGHAYIMGGYMFCSRALAQRFGSGRKTTVKIKGLTWDAWALDCTWQLRVA